MAGCKYTCPTKKNVLDEMKNAFYTLDCYRDTPNGMAEELPDIYMQLIKYINDLQNEIIEESK